MKYLFFTSDNEKYWIETDDNNIAIRQVILSDGFYHVSALEDCLAEGQIIEDELDEVVVEIPNEEFEKIWCDSLRDNRRNWDLAKSKCKLNSYISAKLMYFYPQGAIFKHGDIIIDYIGNKEVQIHEELKMKVVGYDDTNMWIIAK